MRHPLADLLDSLLANPNEKTPRLNAALTKTKIASDIQFVAMSLRTEAMAKKDTSHGNT